MSAKALRETVGFVGVIASLVFVGLEIRQNTQAAQAAAVQEATNVARQQVQMYALDAEANRISMVGGPTPDELSAEEWSRYTWMMVSFFWGMQGLHSQWQLGVLPDDQWVAWNQVLCQNMGRPGARRVWDGIGFYPSDFVAVVEGCRSFQGA
jgi:type II secretory pathway pseudopilin PulG